MTRIDDTLKKIHGGMQIGKGTDEDSSDLPPVHDLPGKPDCPLCGGMGYLRADYPVGHPNFGKVEICNCRSAEISQKIRHRLFAMSNLQELSHLTFENFQPRGRVGLASVQADTLERALNQSQIFSRTLKGWLLLQGKVGCGKTHLAAAVANFVVGMGVPTLFVTVPDLLDMLRFSYSSPDTTFEQRLDEIRMAGLLVLDDFGTQNATAWAQEKLFQILNYRYINQLPVVITTNLLLEQVEERIRSRLTDPELVTRVTILAPDYRNPTDDAGQPELSSLGVHTKRTFANFDPRTDEGLDKEALQSLDKAVRAAMTYAENPRGWFVLTGPYGCGKTHLAAAIANHRAEMGFPVHFMVVPDLMDHLRATFSPGSTIRLDIRFEEIRTSPLLILDDLGAQSMTPWVREKLFQLFNYRYNAELPTVITTADYRTETDPRLLSRLEDNRLCEIHAIQAPGYRGKSTTSKPRGRTRRK